MPGATLLQITELTVSYGGLTAVDSVSLEIAAGELVGLIGPNGAGKTTTIDAICGFTPHRGDVVLDGVDLSRSAPHERADAGLARTWQSIELFDDLTVRENLEVAARRARWTTVFLDVIRPRRSDPGVEAAVEALDRFGLGDIAGSFPRELSHGRQKLVGVARALAADPRVLLLDEPAAGLDSAESLDLGRRLREVIDHTGVGGLLVDHDTNLVFEVCDRIYALDFGRVVASGTPPEVRSNQAVIESYLGVSGTGHG